MALAFVAAATLLKPHILAQQAAKALLESLFEELYSQNRYSGWPCNCFKEKLQVTHSLRIFLVLGLLPFFGAGD